ncbi:MAG: hypothetical protein JNN20_01775 [Betaproteobacteria bacterium]|nr:hypothetical protein [Betaproteobacteria bacterium]
MHRHFSYFLQGLSAALAMTGVLLGTSVAASNDPQTPHEATKPGFTSYSGAPWVINVVPRSAPAGTPRTIVVAGSCPNRFVLDESVAGTLAVRLQPDGTCPPGPIPTGSVSYTTNAVGTLRVVLQFPSDPAVVAETTMVTTAGSRSRSNFNMSGMWYDPATDGSGISFHHNSTTDSVFGTWFMYGLTTAPRPGSRWFSLQGMQWVDNGSALEGLALEATARSAQCELARSCPRGADSIGYRGRVRVSLTDANNARIEAFDVFGTSVFVSNLKRLVF